MDSLLGKRRTEQLIAIRGSPVIETIHRDSEKMDELMEDFKKDSEVKAKSLLFGTQT